MQLCDIPGMKKVGKWLVRSFFLKDEIVDLRKYIDNDAKVLTINHTNSKDAQVLLLAIDEKMIMVAGKENLDFSGKLLFSFVGAKYINRKDPYKIKKLEQKLQKNINDEKLKLKIQHKIEVQKVKLDKIIKSKMDSGHKIVYFPESTWCTDPVKYVENLKWGASRTAVNNDASMQTLNFEYKDNVVYVADTKPYKFENNKNLSDSKFHNDNSSLIREKMASLKYIFAECFNRYTDKEQIKKMFNDFYDYYISDIIPLNKNNEVYNMKEVRPEVKLAEKEFNDLVAKNFEEYPSLDPKYEQTCIFKPYLTPEEVFDTNINYENLSPLDYARVRKIEKER